MRKISLYVLMFLLIVLTGCTNRIDAFNEMIKDIQTEKSVLMISDTSIYDSKVTNLVKLVESCLDNYGRNIQIYTGNQVLIHNDLYILTPFKVSTHTINALVKVDINTKETTLLHEFEAIDYTQYGNYINLYKNNDVLYVYRSDLHQVLSVSNDELSMYTIDAITTYHEAIIIDDIFYRYSTSAMDLNVYDAHDLADFTKVDQTIYKSDLKNPIIIEIELDTFEIKIDYSRTPSFEIIKNDNEGETITLEMLLKGSYVGNQIWDAIEKTELKGIYFQRPLETENGFIIGFKFQNGFLFNKSLNGETNFFLFEYNCLTKESLYLGQSKYSVQHVIYNVS